MSLHGKLDTNASVPKYLNRGQIPAVNVTASGTGYTTVPTVTIAAPTAGIQATATARMRVDTVAVNAGGSGYVVGDVLTLVGGTGSVGTIKVATLTGSAVATVTVLSPGEYVTLPGTPAAVTVTGGHGTSATFNTTFKVGTLIVTNPGSGYTSADLAGVTFGSGAATAVVAKHGDTFTGGPNANQIIIFVSDDEAALEVNKKKGLTSPGWWLFKTYVDSDGNTRYKTEFLTSVMNRVDTDADDDAVAADIASTVSISVHPTPQQVVSPGEATFGITAATTGGSLEYQWQKKSANGRWTNVAGKTTATPTFSPLVAADNGNQYRAVVGNTIGAIKVYSNAALLTYTPTAITVQPANDTTDAGNSDFSVTAVAPGGTIHYQWQTRVPAGTWANVGTDSNALALTGQTVTMEVRVTVTNSNGDAPVVSNTVSSIYGS